MLGGVGAGTAYTVAINTPVKWFSDRRGLATGVVTMAYGGVSVLFIPFVRGGVASAFARTLVILGAATGVACLLAAAVLHDPTDPADSTDPSEPADLADPKGSSESGIPNSTDSAAYTWRETVRTWQFWVLYGVFVVVNGSVS